MESICEAGPVQVRVPGQRGGSGNYVLWFVALQTPPRGARRAHPEGLGGVRVRVRGRLLLLWGPRL